jgi:hypothetical protein
MIDDDFDPSVPSDERTPLNAIGQRLQDERPVPRAAFRGDLRRTLIAGGPARQGALTMSRWRVRVATYSGLGTLLLAVAAAGLVGVGPFSA